MKGMTTCKVCGRDFPLMAEEHYVARDGEKKGVIAAFSVQEEGAWYDAFDCPHCGCQNIMQGRKFTVCEDEEIEEEMDHDGCEGCAHADHSCDEEPCNSCKHNYIDHYASKEEEK